MSNLFKRFQALIPTYPLRVGDVIAYDDGVATIQEQSGVATARGEATIGDRVFFRNGAIEGPAPDLTVEIIEV
jgi:hypothetical protein